MQTPFFEADDALDLKLDAASAMLAALWNTLSFAQLAYGKLSPHYQGEMSGFDGVQKIARDAIAQAEKAGIKVEG